MRRDERAPTMLRGRISAVVVSATLVAWILEPESPPKPIAEPAAAEAAVEPPLPQRIEIARIVVPPAPEATPMPATEPEPASVPTRVVEDELAAEETVTEPEPVPEPAPEPEPEPERMEPEPKVAESEPTPVQTQPREPEPREPPRVREEPAEPIDARPVEVRAASLTRGRKQLRSGRFPPLRASYRRIGFRRYRDTMLALGGRFFLFDTRAHQPLAEIDPRSRQIVGQRVPPGLSHWPRDVTQHLKTLRDLGRRRLGPRVSRVVLLPPESLDAALLGGLDQEARRRGIDPHDIARVDLAYRISQQRLECEVFGLRLRDGSERQVQIRLWLSDRIPRRRT